MSKDDSQVAYAIRPSTALLAVASLMAIRDNDSDEFNAAAVAYAKQQLSIILHQPDTVLFLQSEDLRDMGPSILRNCGAWLP